MHARVNLLRPLENLIDIQMLFRVIHDLQDHAALAGHSNAARGYRLLKFSRGLGGVEALTGGDPVGRRSCHRFVPAVAEASG
jgi:hypothetical protein